MSNTATGALVVVAIAATAAYVLGVDLSSVVALLKSFGAMLSI